MFVSLDKNKFIIVVAYFAAFLGMCGHASSEFFVKLSGVSGIEVTVWRFGNRWFCFINSIVIGS